MLRFASLLKFSYPFEGVVGNLRGVHNARIIGTVVLVSCPAPFMHARERVWSKGSHFLVLEVRILQPNQDAEA